MQTTFLATPAEYKLHEIGSDGKIVDEKTFVLVQTKLLHSYSKKKEQSPRLGVNYGNTLSRYQSIERSEEALEIERERIQDMLKSDITLSKDRLPEYQRKLLSVTKKQ